MQISSYEKCIFYDKPIASILKSLDYTGSVLNSGNSYSVSLNLSQITSKIDASAQIGVWKPIIIEKNPSYSASSNLPYFQGSMPSWEDQPQHSLGYEAFITINNLDSAAFRDLNITGYDNTSSSNINAHIDWFISDINALDCYPDNGILCWYKNVNDIVQQKLSKYTSGKVLKTSSALYDTDSKILLPANIYLKKIDNNKFEVQPDNGSIKGFANLLNSEDLSKIKHNINFSNENNVFSPLIVQIKNLRLNNLNGTYLVDSPDHLFTDVNKVSRFLNYNNSYYDIFISEGDTFSYTVRGDSETYHFVSYKIETNFRLWYSVLSNIIPNYSTLNKLSRSNLKKYCMYLASAPETDSVTKSISGYGWSNNLLTLLNSDFSVSNFLALSNYIYTEYSVFSKSFRHDIFKPTRNINECNINQYIFYRLLNKYDMYLSINGGTAKGFEINKPLINEYINGPNVRVDLNFVSYGKPSQGTYARSGKTPSSETYDQYIQAGPLKVKTIMAGNNFSENYPIINFDALSADGSSSINKSGGMDGYADAYEKLERDPTPNTELLIRPEIKSVGFYKQGGIKIYSSGCHIDEDVGRNALATGSLDGKPVFFDFDTMGEISWSTDNRGNYVYNIESPDSQILKTIKFGFNLGANAGYIKLYRISAFWLRYDNYQLCSCDSFYEEKLNFTKEYARSTSTNVPFMGDVYGGTLPRRIGYVRAGYCDSTTIGKELSDGSNEITIPGVTNHFAPKMLAYGGYEPRDIAKLGLDIPNHPSPGQFMPLLFERNENYSEDMKCYMRTGWILDESITSDTTPLIHSDYIAQKGIFHPFIGWIPFTSPLYSGFNNKTFVNIDSWSTANRLKFQGAGFLFDSRGAGYKKYTSRLYINKGQSVSDSDIYSRTTGRRDINFRMNGMTMRHSLELCIPKKIPEDDITPTNQPTDCVTNNPLTYSYIDPYATEDDVFQPVADYSLYTGDGNADVNDVYIGDISIKLNFLNYVNPKDLKITLLTNFSSDNNNDISSYSNLINSGSEIDNDLKIYLQKLEEQNPYNSIVLFNRETIQNYDRDFCITFSDYAPIYNQLSDLNNHLPHMPYGSWQNKTIKNDECINPSYKVDDYSESACFLFKQMMISKSQTIRNNKFRKWRGQNLLGAKFKLIIETFNEYEESNISSMMDIDYIKNKNHDKFVSSVAENNLCSFEIIIDTTKDSSYHRSVINHPIYEYVSYNKNLAISYIDNIYANTSSKDGYNFIVDGSDVPPVNFNAPLRSIINQNTCKFPKTELNNYGQHKNLPLSGQAIASAALISVFGGAIGGFFGGFGITGGLVGGSIAGGIGGLASKMIIDWFDTKRKTAMVDAYDDAFYEENYDRDGYGTNDRVLVDLSTDGARWYTFDVEIFRYDEACSPIYKPLVIDYKIDDTIDRQTENRKHEDRTLLKIENNSLVFNSTYIPKSELSLRQKNSLFSATTTPQLTFPAVDSKQDRIKFIDWNNNINKQTNNIFGQSFNLNSTGDIYFAIDSADAFFMLKNRLYPNLVFDAINGSTLSLTIVGCGLFYNPSIGRYSTYISTNDPILYGTVKLSDTLQLYDKIKLYIPTAKNLLAFYKENFIRPKYFYKAHYQQALYGEGSWGMGVAYKPVFISSLQFMPDIDLDDFTNQLSYYSYNIPYKTLYKNLNNNTYLYKNHTINTKQILKNKFYTSYNNGYPNNKPDSRDSSIIIPTDTINTSEEGKILFPTILQKTSPLEGKETERILSNHFPSSGRAPAALSASDLLIKIYNIDQRINSINTSLHYDNGSPVKSYEDIVIVKDIRDIPAGNTFCVFLTSSNMIDIVIEAIKKALPIAVEGVLDYGDNKYWFNLSKEQKGVFSRLNSVKVLKKITYRCTEVTNSIDLNCINVCGDAPRREGRDSDENKPPLPSNYTEKEALKQKTTNRLFNFLSDLGSDPDITFTMPDDTIAEHKADIIGTYPAAAGIPWREVVVEKPNIRLSCGPDNNVDTILVIKEYYDVLDGGFLKSAQELFDSSNKIRCRFVRWPRKLKGLDQYFDKYILNNNGTYYFNGRNRYTDGMDIKNYFFSWMCSYTDKSKTRPLEFIVPSYYKLLNEVIFRAFYGSSDGAEFKEYSLKTKSEHEWIPYEYENHKQCFSSSVPEKFFRLAVDGVQNLSKFGFLLRCQLYTQFLKFSFSPKKDITAIQNKIINRCNSYVKSNDANTLKSNTRTLPDQKRVQELLQSAEEYESIKKQQGTVPGNHYTSNDVNQIIEIINQYS